MIEQIRAFPKAELHLHIEGTLEPDLAFALASETACELRFPTVEALARAYDFSDLQSFLHLYYECMAVLLGRRTLPTWRMPTSSERRATASGTLRCSSIRRPTPAGA